MSLFHKHDFDVIVKTVAKPMSLDNVEDITQVNIRGADLARKLICGSTNVLLKCKKCPKIKLIEMVGLSEGL
jgi:hypothetical protein